MRRRHVGVGGEVERELSRSPDRAAPHPLQPGNARHHLLQWTGDTCEHRLHRGPGERAHHLLARKADLRVDALRHRGRGNDSAEGEEHREEAERPSVAQGEAADAHPPPPSGAEPTTRVPSGRAYVPPRTTGCPRMRPERISAYPPEMAPTSTVRRLTRPSGSTTLTALAPPSPPPERRAAAGTARAPACTATTTSASPATPTLKAPSWLSTSTRTSTSPVFGSTAGEMARTRPERT